MQKCTNPNGLKERIFRIRPIKKCLKCLYLQGIAPKQAKNSSVKKLLLIAAVPKTPENYDNVKAILNELNIEALEFTVSADVKMCKCKKCILKK